MQHDGLGSPRHLDGTIGIATVDDVGWVGAGPERLNALDELHGPAVPETISDAVRLRGDLPGVLEEPASRRLGDPVPVQPGHDPQLGGPTGQPAQIRGDPAPLVDEPRSAAGPQLVPRLQIATVEATESPQDVRGPASEHDRNVDAAGDRDVGSGAGSQVVEAQDLARIDRKRRPGLARVSVHARRQIGSGYRNGGRFGELQLRAHEDRLQDRRPLVIADQEICRPQGMLVHPPGNGYPEMVEPRAAEILNARCESRCPNPDDHGAPLQSSRGSSRRPVETPRERTGTRELGARIAPPRPRRHGRRRRRGRWVGTSRCLPA